MSDTTPGVPFQHDLLDTAVGTCSADGPPQTIVNNGPIKYQHSIPNIADTIQQHDAGKSQAALTDEAETLDADATTTHAQQAREEQQSVLHMEAEQQQHVPEHYDEEYANINDESAPADMADTELHAANGLLEGDEAYTHEAEKEEMSAPFSEPSFFPSYAPQEGSGSSSYAADIDETGGVGTEAPESEVDRHPANDETHTLTENAYVADDAHMQRDPSSGRAPRQVYARAEHARANVPYTRTPDMRNSHKLAERRRRKEMRELFDELRDQIPGEEGSKASKWEVLSKAIEHVNALQQERDTLFHEVQTLRASVQQSSSLVDGVEHERDANSGEHTLGRAHAEHADGMEVGEQYGKYDLQHVETEETLAEGGNEEYKYDGEQMYAQQPAAETRDDGLAEQEQPQYEQEGTQQYADGDHEPYGGEGDIEEHGIAHEQHVPQQSQEDWSSAIAA